MKERQINKARPFNVGDIVLYKPIGARRRERHTIASWRPGIDVHATNWRGQSVNVPWHEAERGHVPTR